MRKRIAVFIDVDNTLMEYDAFMSIIGQISMEGGVVYGKIYGVSDRKNRRIIDYAAETGFEIASPSRLKKRVRGFDSRMLIDITELIVSNKSFHSVAVISYPHDFVPLFAKLREYGIEILSLDDIDKASSDLCDILISAAADDGKGKLTELSKLPLSSSLETEKEGDISEILINTYGRGEMTDGDDVLPTQEDDGGDSIFDVLLDCETEAKNSEIENQDDLTGRDGEDLDVLMERVKQVLIEIKDEKN